MAENNFNLKAKGLFVCMVIGEIFMNRYDHKIVGLFKFHHV